MRVAPLHGLQSDGSSFLCYFVKIIIAVRYIILE